MGSRIEMIHEEAAEGRLKEFYDKLGGKVANIIKVHSLFPQSMEDHIQYYKTIMFGKSPIKRAQREMIATVVSSINGCHY